MNYCKNQKLQKEKKKFFRPTYGAFAEKITDIRFKRNKQLN